MFSTTTSILVDSSRKNQIGAVPADRRFGFLVNQIHAQRLSEPIGVLRQPRREVPGLACTAPPAVTGERIPNSPLRHSPLPLIVPPGRVRRRCTEFNHTPMSTVRRTTHRPSL